MSEILEHIELPPRAGEATGSIIWLHGLGADGHDFAPIAPMLELPKIRFIFPHAPKMPVTINAGYVMPSWYDIRTLDNHPDRENLDHVRLSAIRIKALIDREVERGLSPSQILLAGFSQGGAMAFHVGLRYPEALRGIMVLSAYLLAPALLEAEVSAANHTTPMLFCHGRHDPVVPMARGREAHDRASELGPDRAIEWHDFTMQHEVCPRELEIIKAWLQERFPQ